MKATRVSDRFWNKVDRSGGTDACWPWTSATVHNGYGKFYLDGKHRRAHRLTYEWAFGPIPDGYQIDHTCHLRACVNPAHLQAVHPRLNSENLAGAHRDSRTGVRGVYWSPRAARYVAEVYSCGKRHWAGSHRTLPEAEVAVIEMRNRLMVNNLADRSAS